MDVSVHMQMVMDLKIGPAYLNVRLMTICLPKEQRLVSLMELLFMYKNGVV